MRRTVVNVTTITFYFLLSVSFLSCNVGTSNERSSKADSDTEKCDKIPIRAKSKELPDSILNILDDWNYDCDTLALYLDTTVSELTSKFSDCNSPEIDSCRYHVLWTSYHKESIEYSLCRSLRAFKENDLEFLSYFALYSMSDVSKFVFQGTDSLFYVIGFNHQMAKQFLAWLAMNGSYSALSHISYINLLEKSDVRSFIRIQEYLSKNKQQYSTFLMGTYHIYRKPYPYYLQETNEALPWENAYGVVNPDSSYGIQLLKKAMDLGSGRAAYELGTLNTFTLQERVYYLKKALILKSCNFNTRLDAQYMLDQISDK